MPSMELFCAWQPSRLGGSPTTMPASALQISACPWPRPLLSGWGEWRCLHAPSHQPQGHQSSRDSLQFLPNRWRYSQNRIQNQCKTFLLLCWLFSWECVCVYVCGLGRGGGGNWGRGKTSVPVFSNSPGFSLTHSRPPEIAAVEIFFQIPSLLYGRIYWESKPHGHKEARQKWVNAIQDIGWFRLCEVWEQAKLTLGNRKQNNDYLWGGSDCLERGTKGLSELMECSRSWCESWLHWCIQM